MRSGCRGFESRSGHLIFSSICSVYIDRHIRVDLSDDEQYVRNMPCYTRFKDFPGFPGLVRTLIGSILSEATKRWVAISK